MSFIRKILIGFLLLGIFCSCAKEDTYIPVSPVVLDLTQVPYPKLSDYKFFDGELKDLKPAYGLIPYQPASSLFTDYAEKSRFIWMPKGVKATYASDGTVLNFPVGSVLIKNFYYSHAMPADAKKVVETRLMILKSDGWVFVDYVWNEEQTDAFLQINALTLPGFSFKKSTGEQITTDYKVPSQIQCGYCHKVNNQNIPIGVKPQNINWSYAYSDGSKNQLQKLIEFGYLENSLPATIVSTVDYTDAAQPLDLRVRSYFDANCAHCHEDGAYASMYNLRFDFTESVAANKLGICKNALHFVPGYPGKIVIGGNPAQSILYYKMSTNNPLYQMPVVGRTMVHTEGVQLIEQWINSLAPCN